MHAKKKKKKKKTDTEADSNPQPRVLEFNALPTWPLHYIEQFNYKSFITNLTKKKKKKKKNPGGHFDA